MRRVDMARSWARRFMTRWCLAHNRSGAGHGHASRDRADHRCRRNHQRLEIRGCPPGGHRFRSTAVYHRRAPDEIRRTDGTPRVNTRSSTITDSTGGDMFYPTNLNELDAIFDHIDRELRTQYLLGYYPNPDAAAGKLSACRRQGEQRRHCALIERNISPQNDKGSVTIR